MISEWISNSNSFVRCFYFYYFPAGVVSSRRTQLRAPSSPARRMTVAGQPLALPVWLRLEMLLANFWLGFGYFRCRFVIFLDFFSAIPTPCGCFAQIFFGVWCSVLGFCASRGSVPLAELSFWLLEFMGRVTWQAACAGRCSCVMSSAAPSGGCDGRSQRGSKGCSSFPCRFGNCPCLSDKFARTQFLRLKSAFVRKSKKFVRKT